MALLIKFFKFQIGIIFWHFLLVDNSAVVADQYKLTEEQKLMLEMSEADIKYNRVISQNDLDKMGTEWLKGM